MIGETVESRPGPPVAAILLAAAGLLFIVAIGLTAANPEYCVLGIVPLLMAVGALHMRAPALRFRIEEDRLAFEQPDRPDLHYDDLLGVRRSRGSKHYSSVLHYKGGTLRLPENLNVDSKMLADFLREQVPPQVHDEMPAALESYCSDQIGKFGAEKIRIYRAHDLPAPPQERSVGFGVWCGFSVGAIIAAGLLVALLPQKESDVTGFLVCGGFTALIGLLFAWAARARGNPKRHRRWSETTLILTPSGLALFQDDMKGKLRWDEIQAIEQPPVRRSLTTNTARSRNGIGVQVAGAYIVIKDMLDQDAYAIAAEMRRYWKG